MPIKPKNYFIDRKCHRCGSVETTQGYGGPRWHRYYDEKGNWDMKSYLCHTCHTRSSRACRNKNISKDSNTGKGYIGEQIFCKTRGLKNCNIEKDNFDSKEDTIDPEYGIIQIKMAKPLKRGSWKFNIGMEHDFDHLAILCMDKYMKNIEKIYIIPEEELYGKTSITIPKNSQKWKEFRVDEEPYNNTYHNMKIEDCPVLRDDRIPR